MARGSSTPKRLAIAVAGVLVLGVGSLLAVRAGSGPPPSTRAIPPTSAPAKTTLPSAQSFPPCPRAGRALMRPVTAKTLTSPWLLDAPAANTTYDFTGVTSTAYPSNNSAFAVGTKKPAANLCFTGGTLKGTVDPKQPWEHYHDSANNAACLKIIAIGWMQVSKLHCDGVEDGFRPRETSDNANNVSMYVSGTYFTNVRDDCLENDGTIGGVLYDSLWEQCNTGISERPSKSQGTWTSPPEEVLVIDHMLIGLYETLHGSDQVGENAIFKWSSSANRAVIKCSTFKVNGTSLNGSDTMAFPATVDDSACPGSPSTLVWLGGGSYPGAIPAGLRVTSDVNVWNTAVAKWKCTHGYQSTGCPA